MPKGKSAISPGEKAKKNPTSFKAAIAAYCYHDCVGEDKKNSHDTKHFIGTCKNTQCHLWPLRPWQDSTGGNLSEMKRLRSDKQPHGNDT